MYANTNKIGARLKAYAKKRRYEQAELARKAGMSRVSLNRFFNGHTEIRATQVIALMYAMGLRPLDSVPDVNPADGQMVCKHGTAMGRTCGLCGDR